MEAKIKYPLPEQLQLWSKMTADNNHTEVRLAIARWLTYDFGLNVSDALRAFHAVFEEQELRGCLTYLMADVRHVATQHMMERVRALDAELYDMINGCL